MKLFINLLLFLTLSFGACPEGFYEDDCGNCWMPYCYNFYTHTLSYDINIEDCDETNSIWVLPGSENDPFFNNMFAAFFLK